MKNILRALALLAWATAHLSAADTIELKQRWMAGKQYFMTMQMTQATTLDVGDQKVEQAVTMTTDMSMAVRPHEDGKRKRLTMKYEHIAMDLTMNGQRLGFDSDKPDETTDPLGLKKTLGSLAGKELKLLTDENDVVSEVENYDEFVQEMTGKGAIPGFEMSKMFTRESFVEMMRQVSLQAFPKRPVTTGDTWPFENKVSMPQLGTATLKGTYAFKGMVEHKGTRCAEIAVDATIAAELGESAPGPLAALGMKLSDSTSQGTIWFDPQLGIARDVDLNQGMTMSMKSPINPDAAITIPMKQRIKIGVTKVVDLK